jgi:hypothetical protein
MVALTSIPVKLKDIKKKILKKQIQETAVSAGPLGTSLHLGG